MLVGKVFGAGHVQPNAYASFARAVNCMAELVAWDD